MWNPLWYWVSLRARTSCLSAGLGSRRSSVPSVRSASRSPVLLSSLVSAVCCHASCNGKVVSLRVPGLHSSVLRALRCSRDCLGRPDCRSWGPGHSRGCTPFRSAGLQTSSRRTPCLVGPCCLGCPLGFWGSLSPCRCTPASIASVAVISATVSPPSVGTVAVPPGSSVITSAEASV